MPTYTPKASEIERAWLIVDADGLVLGRLATEVARILRGKHKPTYTPHIDTGDHVVIINADKVVLTSDKAEKKKIFRHSGFPGGINNPWNGRHWTSSELCSDGVYFFEIEVRKVNGSSKMHTGYVHLQL